MPTELGNTRPYFPAGNKRRCGCPPFQYRQPSMEPEDEVEDETDDDADQPGDGYPAYLFPAQRDAARNSRKRGRPPFQYRQPSTEPEDEVEDETDNKAHQPVEEYPAYWSQAQRDAARRAAMIDAILEQRPWKPAPGMDPVEAGPGLRVVSYLKSIEIPSGYTSQEVDVENLPMFFDLDDHDWNGGRQSVDKRVFCMYIDPVGLCATDLRARRAKFSCPALVAGSRGDHAVYRAVFHCAGTCRRLPPDPIRRSDRSQAYREGLVAQLKADRQSAQALEASDEELENVQTSQQIQKKAKKKKAPVCDVCLYIEMTPKSLSRRNCIVWTLPSHTAPEAHIPLRLSAHLRSTFHHVASQSRLTLSALNGVWEDMLANDPYVKVLKTEAPRRLPDPGTLDKVLQQAIQVARSR